MSLFLGLSFSPGIGSSWSNNFFYFICRSISQFSIKIGHSQSNMGYNIGRLVYKISMIIPATIGSFDTRFQIQLRFFPQAMCSWKKWYFVTKNFFTYCEKKKILEFWEKLLKCKAEDQEFAKFMRSLQQFIQTVKGQNNFW